MTDLETEYRKRFSQVLTPLASALEGHLQECLSGEPRIDRIVARAKSVDRFLSKAQKSEDGTPKYTDPLRQIQDQIGARIITFYLSDVDRVSAVIKRYFRSIESRTLVPDSEWKFGYFGRHNILLIPTDLISSAINKADVPEFFELQIKTLFQHAWSEANHDLGYKPSCQPLSADAERYLAFASAQAWGADKMFDNLFREQNDG